MTRFLSALTFLLLPAAALLLPGQAQADAGAFHASDADGSGSLDFREFTTLVGHMAASGRRIAVYVQRTGLYGTAFGRVDSNGDGLASPNELLAAEAWINAYARRHDAAARPASGSGRRVRN